MNGQFFVFAVSLGCGVLIGVMFDFFRAFRKKFRFGTVAVGVQDVLFWLLSALVTFLLTYLANGGELRWYIFFAVFCGALIYNATISRAVLRLIIFVLNIIGFAAKGMLKLLLLPFIIASRLLKKPFFFICIPFRRFARFLKLHLTGWSKNIKKVKKRLKLY